MEITIQINGQALPVAVSIEVYTYLEQAAHRDENLAHEQRQHWDMRELDEYILANECSRSYILTPEQIVCRKETLAEIMEVLNACTEQQRQRFFSVCLRGHELCRNRAVLRLFKKRCLRKYFSGQKKL